MSTKLYVGNLPYETTESDLQTLFEGVRTGEPASTSSATGPPARRVDLRLSK